QKQHAAEVNNRRRTERAAHVCRSLQFKSGNKGHDDELQTDQNGRGRPNDHVEVLPFNEYGHVSENNTVEVVLVGSRITEAHSAIKKGHRNDGPFYGSKSQN